MVQYGRTSCSSWAKSERATFGRTVMGKAIWENPIETWLGENSKLGTSLCASWKRIILICVYGWHQIDWKETKHWSDVENTQQRSWFGRTNIFPGSCILGLHSKTMWNKQRYCGQLQNHVRIANFRGESRKITIPSKSSYFFMVLWYGWSRKVVCGTILWVGKQDDTTTLQSIYSMHRWPPLQRRRNEICWRIVTSMLSNCSEMFILDKNWTTWYFIVSKKACTINHKMDQKLSQNDWIDWFHIFIIHVNTNNIVMWVILPNNADWDCFKTLTSREILKIRNPLLEEHCAFFGSHTFVPISWMCKKQTAASHSSTESEIISLDAGLRLDGIPALDLWDLIVSVLGNVSRVSNRSGQPDRDVHQRHKSQKKIDVMNDIDSVPSSVQSARQEALLYVFEDNEAVIKMIIKRRSPTMRHVSRTHRVALDWLFDRINLDPKIQIKHIDTKNQLADILTKGNFTRDEWNHSLNLFNISDFSSTVCSAAMAKRAQQESGEERVTAKSRPMMNLTARMPSVVSSSTSSSPGKTWYGYQDPGKSVARDDRSEQGKPETTSWGMKQQVRPHHEEPLLGGNAHSARYGELIHDRSAKPEAVNHQEQAYSEIFVMGSDAAEFVNKVKDQVRKRQKNVERRRFWRRAFNNLGNVHGCDVKCGDIHGKEFLNYSKCCQESWRSHIETDVWCHRAVGEHPGRN